MVVIELIILLERKKTAKKKRFFVLYDCMSSHSLFHLR